jgi:hypothetical protein
MFIDAQTYTTTGKDRIPGHSVLHLSYYNDSFY